MTTSKYSKVSEVSKYRNCIYCMYCLPRGQRQLTLRGIN